MSVTDLANRYINDHLYGWAYDEAVERFKLEQLFGGEEWPEGTITIRRPALEGTQGAGVDGNVRSSAS